MGRGGSSLEPPRQLLCWGAARKLRRYVGESCASSGGGRVTLIRTC